MSQKNEQSQEQSNSKSAVLGLQHLLAMYSGSILVPIMIKLLSNSVNLFNFGRYFHVWFSHFLATPTT